MPAGRVSGRIALVTGAGQGIGAEIARTLAAEGAKVILVDKKDDGLKSVDDALLKEGHDCFSLRADITKKSDLERLFLKVAEKYGKLDILVNNAGTIRPALFDGMDEADWDFILNVDLKGLVFCTQSAARLMKENGYGRIVNISSMSAAGVYMPGFSSYSAAKAAVNDFTKNAARELGAWGITVNAVAPGEILTALTYQDQTKEAVEEKLKRSTDMTMVRRIGQTRDVANAVCFLSSEEASFITGVILPVDGGRIDRM
jgi:3-oxoacyl-[acyl-carrier protein] reductase